MPDDTLTHRERWLRTMRYQPVDRVPDLEFSAWRQTIARWRQEGMETRGQTRGDVLDAYFGTDSADYGPGLWIFPAGQVFCKLPGPLTVQGTIECSDPNHIRTGKKGNKQDRKQYRNAISQEVIPLHAELLDFTGLRGCTCPQRNVPTQRQSVVFATHPE